MKNHIDDRPTPSASPASEGTLRPGEEDSLRRIAEGQGYVAMDKRFLRGLLAEIDKARPAPSEEDLLS